jgi:hypothetical protein
MGKYAMLFPTNDGEIARLHLTIYHFESQIYSPLLSSNNFMHVKKEMQGNMNT